LSAAAVNSTLVAGENLTVGSTVAAPSALGQRPRVCGDGDPALLQRAQIDTAFIDPGEPCRAFLIQNRIFTPSCT
jgi:hypothetical protein